MKFKKSEGTKALHQYVLSIVPGHLQELVSLGGLQISRFAQTVQCLPESLTIFVHALNSQTHFVEYTLKSFILSLFLLLEIRQFLCFIRESSFEICTVIRPTLLLVTEISLQGCYLLVQLLLLGSELLLVRVSKAIKLFCILLASLF